MFSYTKRVASVAKAMWYSRVGRFFGTEIRLHGLGAAPNQRLPAFLPVIGRNFKWKNVVMKL